MNFFKGQLIELILKILHCGGVKSWAQDGWNQLDGAIVLTSLVSYMPMSGDSSSMMAIKGIRALRVLRPLRAIRRFPSLSNSINTLLQCIPATSGLIVLMLSIWFFWAAIGQQLLQGKLKQCADPQRSLANCRAGTIPDVLNFDSIPSGMLTLFTLFKLDGWETLVWGTLAQIKSDGAMLQSFVGLYFV